MINLCVPAIIYLIFSLTQIIIDTFQGFYNTAFIKIIIMIMITILLQILCERGLNIVSWIIVFVPFILMTVIVSIILYVFGLNATTGSIDYSHKNKNNNHNQNTKDIYYDSEGNIIIYDPYYDAIQNPVYYKEPNIIVPTPNLPNNQFQNQYKNKNQPCPIPSYSSSPMFQ